MKEYLDNGVKLGWLINPEEKQVEIYLPGQEKQVLDNPNTIADHKCVTWLSYRIRSNLELIQLPNH